MISYADGVDNGTAIGLGSDTTQLEVLGTDVATQGGTIYEGLQSRGFKKTGTGTPWGVRCPVSHHLMRSDAGRLFS